MSATSSSKLLDMHYNRAKSFDFENANIQDLEKEAELVQRYLAVENYKTIHKFFRKQVRENSSDPYQDVCDNYNDFKRLLKEYEPAKGNEKFDYMKRGNETILSYIEYGFNNCHNWVKEDYYDHYRDVNHYMTCWEKTLVEQCGYNFD